MLDNLTEDSLIIVKDNYKSSFIRELRKSNKLFNIKIMGLNEFKKKFYFNYDKKTVFYIHKKYNVIKEIAEIYLENLYFLDNIDNEKIKLLQNIMKDLKSNNLLTIDKPFKNYLRDRTIFLYDINYVDKFYEKMLAKLEGYSNVIKLEPKEKEISKKELYKFPNRDEEIAFVASQISELLKSGIDINRIKLANIQDDYIFPLVNTFKSFHIPLELDSNESISSTVIVNKFKEFYSEDIKDTLEKVKPYIKTKKDEKIYKMIIDVLNDYTWCENYLEVKDFIFEDLKDKKVPTKSLKNAVRTIDFVNDTLNREDYVFLLNFNQGVIPQNNKDENFLNDELRNKLGISNSVDLNKKALKNVQEKITHAKNLIVTYSERNLQGELYISNAYSEDLFIESVPSKTFTHSDEYNKITLIKEKDEYRKYGTVSENLVALNGHYKNENYQDFDNKFKGFNKDILNTYLQNKLTLSYSSMNSYYQCGFRYYLDNVIRVNKFEDTFEIVIGNIFHEILSKAFKENFDFEESWNHTIESCEFEFGNKEKFFLDILKEELKYIISEIESQKEYTSLDKALYEQKISIPIKDDGSVEFKGFVDKIMYGEFGDGKVVSIIDYKTGNPELNIDNCFYGLDMQLPIYAYLIKNFEELKDARVGGFYLQKILNNIKSPDKKRESLKLQGYSNSNTGILNLVDKSYNDSKMIRSLRTSANGFYAYSKVLSNDEIDRLTALVKSKIDEAANDILSAKFDINPKQLEDRLEGCKFCKYKDICYMKNKDIKKLQKITRKDFLGGEKDDKMD